MIFGTRFFRSAPALPPGLEEAVQIRQALPRPDPQTLLGKASFALVDVDVTGTSTRTDRVTGFAVAIIEGDGLDMGQLHHFPFDPDDRQATLEATARFFRQIGRLPLVTYNSAFVVAMLDKLLEQQGAPTLAQEKWLDLLWLMPALHGGELTEHAGLLDWVRELGLPVIGQHHALADVYAMAHLFLIALERAEAQGMQTLEDLERSQSSRRWLRG
ncbi:3'-5' exonuclease [Azovibrio restrictus]|uniref:3'-5' exonuclease n=1 Tax=Azovibrio restrictus TaxID=146938 RepID=UPI0026EC7BD8|nr:3'-5' exonuclease [Azovibrio restrictus]